MGNSAAYGYFYMKQLQHGLAPLLGYGNGIVQFKPIENI
jgi:hypothetical protein